MSTSSIPRDALRVDLVDVRILRFSVSSNLDFEQKVLSGIKQDSAEVDRQGKHRRMGLAHAEGHSAHLDEFNTFVLLPVQQHREQIHRNDSQHEDCLQPTASGAYPRDDL